MLKILYIGNFRPIHSTENHVRQSLEAIGHNVVPIQEDKTTVHEILSTAVDNDVDLVLYTRTWGIPYMLPLLARLEENHHIPTASYHLDIYYGIARSDLYERLAPLGITGIENDPFWRTKYVFTVDGDPAAQDYFKSLGINHHYLRAGVFHKEAYMAPHTEWRHNVAFVGSYQYHPEWPYRQELINFLKDKYKDLFGKYGPPEQTIRNEKLNELYANVKVIVGDSLVPNFTKPGYWSDRVYETLGRGGFLIHPRIKGMEEEFKDKAHIIFYDFGDFEQLQRLIDYYVEHDEEREGIRKMGHALTSQFYTYKERMQDMLIKIGETEPRIKKGL